ncbi:hypothetical protein L1281_001467 [Neisseria sp. HSC-16F19]|nr:DUF4303 domain-containing protein [Neisseria sp. HSC-16F19]MCP2040877.1 hypothetical protein [Neisseria sp. HSC-16F19]
MTTLWNDAKRQAVRDTLLQFSRQGVAAFLDAHAGETFYAFAYDCNLEYGEVNLCLNTEQGFQTALGELQAMYAEYRDNADAIRQVRYNTGDWDCQCFDTVYVLNEEELAELSACLDEGNTDAWFAFLDDLAQVCRQALLAFTHTPEYERITKTDDFVCYVIDHEQDVADALATAIRHPNETQT